MHVAGMTIARAGLRGLCQLISGRRFSQIGRSSPRRRCAVHALSPSVTAVAAVAEGVLKPLGVGVYGETGGSQLLCIHHRPHTTSPSRGGA